jgi:hypothetical protein
VFTGFPGELEVLLGHFPGGLNGLGAAGGEEHPVQVARGVVREALGQLDRGRGCVSPQREELERARLPGGDLGEFGPPVTHLHCEQPGQCVQVALAAIVEDVDALAAGDDRRGDSRAVPGEVAPQVAISLGRQVLGHLAREPNV